MKRVSDGRGRAVAEGEEESLAQGEAGGEGREAAAFAFGDWSQRMTCAATCAR